MYQKQIEQLVILQQVDDEILILRKEIEEAPRTLTALEEQLAALDSRKEQVTDKLEILKSKKTSLTGEIEEDVSKIKKSKNKLMMVGNTKEYHAMMREMDSLEKLNRLRDDEQDALNEELERQEELLKGIAEEVAGVKEHFDAQKATLDQRIAEAQKSLDSLDRKRKKACKVVPPPILGRYEFIRERMENPVIVPVADGVCQGCHIKIPPQNYNDLQKGQQILSCPNCQRLIYWEEHISQAG
ncbi:zinc ribbon domain-containing protein [Pseudodesulfovibrio tunisiensis]|uniref:zinc ribbon domain-containing protein n=1 Tax=Pseudodesulfovibrio tunisiensis TaxID=463192 RepID=UPI001FB5280E|nr:C4-type zinc ribbon domain-containing protein [Pseudodesulfovibrio tunisiensis]